MANQYKCIFQIIVQQIELLIRDKVRKLFLDNNLWEFHVIVLQLFCKIRLGIWLPPVNPIVRSGKIGLHYECIVNTFFPRQ